LTLLFYILDLPACVLLHVALKVVASHFAAISPPDIAVQQPYKGGN
jgi:hypothetical protein